MRDEVAAGQHKQVKVTFKPSGQKSEDELLILKIEDGKQVEVKCIGIVNEAKCTFAEKMVEFGSIPVGLPAKNQMFHIKNHYRAQAIFHVENPYEELSVFPMQGKIGGESKLMFTVGFKSDLETDFNAEIIVHIRGGKPMRIPVHALARIPELFIE